MIIKKSLNLINYLKKKKTNSFYKRFINKTTLYIQLIYKKEKFKLS